MTRHPSFGADPFAGIPDSDDQLRHQFDRKCPEHSGPLAACEDIHEARYQAEMDLDDLDGYDRNGVVDAAGHVHSDADPGL